MTTRAVWVDEGNDADYWKLKAHGIVAPYYSIRDPRVTLAYLRDVEARGFTPGVYAVAGWPGTGLTGSAFADWLDLRLQAIAPGTPPAFPMVDANIESHDIAGFVLPFWKRYREHRPKRITDWVLEGFQGGLLSPVDAGKIAAAGCGVYAENYTGSMQPLDAVANVLNLARASLPTGRLGIMYDAAELPPSWSGKSFTAGRLP